MTETLRQYLETALWSSTDEDGTPLDENYSIDNFAPEAIASAWEDLDDFLAAQRDKLDSLDVSDDQHAHDFWLTRNRHGTGFWDRGYGPVGQALTDAAHAYGGSDVYVGDDGQLYLS